jgi:hypothetical protein
VVGPVLAVALLFALVLGHRLHTYHDNATGFVLFGRSFAHALHPPHNALFNSPYGYDGQFFYVQATDPLLVHNSTIAAFRASGQAFRLGRMAYPALAYVLSAGQARALPWSMVAANVLVVLAITAGFAVYARRRGRSGWWALAIGLMAGLLTGTLRDLSDPVAVASMLGGVLMWQLRRRWWGAGLLTVAVLAREPMAFAVVAVVLDAGARWWRQRHAAGALRAVAQELWPVVLLPAAGFLVWHAYIDVRYGGSLASSGLAFLPPFQGVADEIHHAFQQPLLRDTLWSLAYLGLMMAGIASAVWAARRRLTAPGASALLFGLTLLVLVFGDQWSYTRLSAPMFAVLLADALERRSRPTLLICAAAAALTPLAPLTTWMRAV